MSVQEAILEKMRELPPDRQEEFLKLAAFLRSGSGNAVPLKDMRGLCADLGVSISEEDIAEARREMWGGVPRENAD